MAKPYPSKATKIIKVLAIIFVIFLSVSVYSGFIRYSREGHIFSFFTFFGVPFLLATIIADFERVRLPLARYFARLFTNKERALNFSKKLNTFFVTHYSEFLSEGKIRENPHATSSTLEGVELFSNLLFYVSYMLLAIMGIALLLFLLLVWI